MMTYISLMLNITYPTRITRTIATIIDNIFSNSLEHTAVSSIISNKSISDHLIIFTFYDNFINMRKQANTTKKIYKNTDYDGLKNYISQTIYSNQNKDFNCNPNNNYNTFENKLTVVISKHTTMKRIKLNKSKLKKNPWITEGPKMCCYYRGRSGHEPPLLYKMPQRFSVLHSL